MKLSKVIAPVVLVTGLLLSACTPPMPPELRAQLADQYVSCVSGDFNISAPAELTNVSSWLSDYNSICGANGTLADLVADPTATVDGYITDDLTTQAPCTISQSTPVGLDGAVAVANLAGLEGVILSPSVIFGILDGQITSWNDPFITELNPDIELPSTSITVEAKATPAVLQSFKTWMKALDSTAWANDPKLITADSTALQTSTAVTAPVDGSIGLYPYSFAANNSLGLVSIQGSEVVDPNLESLASGATQLRFNDTTSLGAPIYDVTIPPTSLQGDDQATTPWGALYAPMLQICSGTNSLAVQAFARFVTRLDAQGSLVDLSMTSLSENIRQQAMTILATGLPEPQPIPSDLVAPNDPATTPESTDSATPEPSIS
jgi:ABC-type phosphate transport system substrate-binding protein